MVQILDESGVPHTYGSLAIGDEICRIGENAEGQPTTVCEEIFLPELDPIEEEEDLSNVTARLLQKSSPLVFSPLRRNRPSPQINATRRLVDDSGAVLDVLVVWTREAECLQSSLLVGCTLTPATRMNMEGLVELAIEETNEAFELSGVQTELRLVHAYRHPDYVEPASNQFYSGLADITGTNDGEMDDVHMLRDLYGADLVSLILGTGGFCGVAHLGPSRDKMFSAIKYSCATGYFSFGHEIAHNLGCKHDRGTRDECDETANPQYWYGYRDAEAGFRSILSYECNVNDCDITGTTPSSCPRVQFFSNDENFYESEMHGSRPMGNAFHDNARRINEQLATAASFSPAWDCSVDGDCDDENMATIDFCNTANNVCVFQPMPTSAPSRSPVSSAPTHDLPSYTSLGSLETVTVAGVGDSWKTISLSAAFDDPVPVCSLVYDSGTSLSPAVIRMEVLSSISFAIRLQEASMNPPPGSVGFRNVKCIIVEAGSWQLPDGSLIEAHLVESATTDGSTSWFGSRQQFSGTYSQPVVIGQVTSFNDPSWSVFWSRGADNLLDCADQENFWVGLHVGEDPDTIRNQETIGYIVMESGIHSKIGDLELESGQGLEFIRGYSEGNLLLYSFDTPFEVVPEVIVVSQCKMRGLDGGWAVLTSDPTETSFGLAIDEDVFGDGERAHTEETVNYIAFSGEGSLQLFPLMLEPSSFPPSSEPSTFPTTAPSTSVAPSTLPSISQAPTVAIQGLLEVLVIPSVSDAWVTAPLGNGFADPVPVCSVVNAADRTSNPAVVRIKNLGAGSFDLRLQNPSSVGTVEPRTVNCLVVEVGEWEIGGLKLEAKKYLSTRKDKKDDWVGEEQSYVLDYTNPVVLGQVVSFNDEAFSVFWSRGSEIASAPSAESLRVGLHTGEDGTNREPEIVGYIVMEGGEQDVTGGVEFQANLGPSTVGGYVQAAHSYSFVQTFSQIPAAVVVSQGGVNGNDGGWAVLTSTRSTSSFGLGIDEDQTGDVEREHINEKVFYAAFSHEGLFPLANLRSASPSMLQSQTPTDAPTGHPSEIPSVDPSIQPSVMPSVLPSSKPDMEGILQVLVVASAGSSWTTVPLASGFTDPIPVCSIVYAEDKSSVPAVVRIRNVDSTSFDIRLQNPSQNPVQIESSPVHCLVVEQGDWEIDGLKLEAKKYMTSRKDNKGNWVGEARSYSQHYTNPVVLGQVISYNNEEFSVFWSRGGSRFSSPTSESLWLGKHTGETWSSLSSEMIGYIVLEGRMHGVLGSTEFESNLAGSRTAGAYVSGPFNNGFIQSFNQPPEVVVASQSGMNGDDGSWAVVTSTSSVSSFGVAVDEDQLVDSERWHWLEYISYAAFASTGQFTLNAPQASSTAPSEIPTSYPSSRPSTQPTEAPSSSPSSAPSDTSSFHPSIGPTGLPTTRPSSQASGSPTTVPTTVPTAQPSMLPSDVETSVPSGNPSLKPSLTPSNHPTLAPNQRESSSPSVLSSTPSKSPSSRPSEVPSASPTTAPSASLQPSIMPSDVESPSPSSQPSASPSYVPTSSPSQLPSSYPSVLSSAPSVSPTSKPSEAPTASPTTTPSGQPSMLPTKDVTSVPSAQPSRKPSNEPTAVSSQLPSSEPSELSSAPSKNPTSKPSVVPTAGPTTAPSGQPSVVPSMDVTSMPSSQPSVNPSNEPTVVSSQLPSAGPSVLSSAPSNTPTSDPSEVASASPTKAPSGQPSMLPSEAVTSGPSANPSMIPSIDPTPVSSSTPSKQTSWQPSQHPSVAPSDTSSAAPSAMPTSNPSSGPSESAISTGGMWESIVVNSVTSEWTTVPFTTDMQDPVVVCSVEYDHTTSNGPAAVRMQNVQSSSFAIRLQSASPQIAEITSGRNVHCLAVEEGRWELPDGRSVQVTKYTNTVTDWRRKWSGEEQAYLLPFTSPVVVGQVMTSNDPDFSVFWASGSDRRATPNSSVLRTGLHSGEYEEVIDDETIGYIVIEGGIHTDLGNGVEVESALGPVNVRGTVQGTFTYNFLAPFENGAPEVKIVSQAAMKGSDGSWAVLTTHTSTAASFSIAVDEDQDRDSERNHTFEAVAYVAISQQGVVPLFPAA